MSQSGRSFDPTSPPAPQGPVVDYTLARRATISSVRRGVLNSTDVCDAHPELMRAGKNIGDESESPCPICSHDSLRRVRYVFGDELRHNNGRIVYPIEWLDELSRSYDHFTCYLVEVCIDCSWNHLLRSYAAGRRWRSPRDDGPRRARRGENIGLRGGGPARRPV